MKQMKFFLLALTVLMGVSFTSCLNNDNNNTFQGRLLVKVNQYDYPVTFTDAGGMKLIPTTPIMNADKSMAWIYCQFDQSAVDQNATSINIILLAEPTYIDELYVQTHDIEENAPLMTLEPATSMGTITGAYFDKDRLILPVTFKFKNYDKEEDTKKEIQKHSFTLFYDSQEEVKNGVLKLYLRHYIAPESGEDGEKIVRTDNTYDQKVFNLSSVMSMFKSKNEGKNPTKVEVVIKQNESDNDYTKATEKSYTYDYPFKD